MDYTDLITYVGGGAVDSDYAQDCWNQAVTLVDDFVSDNVVPSGILDWSYREVGSELYHRKNAPNGIAQYNEFNGAPVRIARDPMVGIYPTLSQYVVMGL